MVYINGNEILFPAQIHLSEGGEIVQPIPVVQETGDSEEAVMSQKAVTEALEFTLETANKYAREWDKSDYNFLSSWLSSHTKQIEEIRTTITGVETELTILNEGAQE